MKDPSEKAPDLSSIGGKRNKQWIAGYLLQKTLLDGEKHKKRFGGGTEDLKALATWLESLK